jgi:short-subunit dehydrogenase
MSDKSVLITGSSKGLGKSLALLFSKKGYNIIIHGRNKKDLELVRTQVLKNKVSCDIVMGDLTGLKTIDALAKIAQKKGISILINNAAIMHRGNVESLTDKETDEVLNVNLASIIKLTKRIYSFFLKEKLGMIININSTAGQFASKEHALYCSSKYGLKGFTDALRLDAKPNNIRVLGVYPAGMWTTFHDRAGGRKNIERTMKTEEVAQIIFDLVGYDSVHIDEISLNRMYR